MTPKEKAKELFDMMFSGFQLNIDFHIAKHCSIIAVNEIIKSKPYLDTEEEFYYWEEVKNEIEKL